MRREQGQSEITSRGVSGYGDRTKPETQKPFKTGTHIIRAGGKRVFWGKPIIRDERSGPGVARDVPDEMAKSLGRAPVEPAAMQMKNSRVGGSRGWLAPPTGNFTDAVLAIGNAFGRRSSPDDRIEGRPGGHAAQLTF